MVCEASQKQRAHLERNLLLTFLGRGALPRLFLRSSQKHSNAACVWKCRFVRVATSHNRVCQRAAAGGEAGEVTSALEQTQRGLVFCLLPLVPRLPSKCVITLNHPKNRFRVRNYRCCHFLSDRPLAKTRKDHLSFLKRLFPSLLFSPPWTLSPRGIANPARLFPA